MFRVEYEGETLRDHLGLRKPAPAPATVSASAGRTAAH